MLFLAGPLLADGRPMTIDDLLAVKSVTDPQISPDGESVVYVVSELDRATDKTNSSLWMIPTAGGEPKRLTTAPGTNNHPRWSPDGKTIAFVSSRGGSSQVWILPVDGGEARQLTKLPIDVSGPVWSPKGKQIAFTAEVYPGTTPEQTAAKDKEKEASKSKVRTFDHLMIRHWNAWNEGKKSHLFVADATTGEARDLTPKLEVNTPPAPFGGSTDYAWSPDGKELAFTAEPVKDHAWSTNTDIWTVPAGGGELETSPPRTPAPTPSRRTRPTARCSATSARPGRASRPTSGSSVRGTRRQRDDRHQLLPRSARAVVCLAERDLAGRRHRQRGDRADRHVPDPQAHRDGATMTGRPVTGGANNALSIGPEAKTHGLRAPHRQPARRDLPLGRGQAQAAGL